MALFRVFSPLFVEGSYTWKVSQKLCHSEFNEGLSRLLTESLLRNHFLILMEHPKSLLNILSKAGLTQESLPGKMIQQDSAVEKYFNLLF